MHLPDIKEKQSSDGDELHEKFKYIRSLEELEKKGVSLRKQYDMESSLLEMKGEYETIIREKEKANSVKFQGKQWLSKLKEESFRESVLSLMDEVLIDKYRQ